MKPALLKRISAELEARGLKRLEPEAWTLAVEPGVELHVRLRSTRSIQSFWLEFGLGVRFEEIEKACAEAMGESLMQETGTLGADLRHLVDRKTASGWDFESEAQFEATAFETLMATFDAGLAKMMAYTDRARVRLLVDNACAGIFEDPVTCRFHHYAPVVLYLDGEFGLASEYLCNVLEDAKRRSGDQSSPFIDAYMRFSSALHAHMTH
ncbi:hypothetical protein [Variovorax paradoxus]|jgi:hypothetical protein|uniref:hypothetical protein n=1 Tax=Variovorax paradoxus TaxID=34073 RepID=UPI0029C61B04|nr:hypothetical protein [Variovorax paradoxus]WPH24274.1 hypothetical protein RZE78_28870 [Variovorax paradoxus]